MVEITENKIINVTEEPDSLSFKLAPGFEIKMYCNLLNEDETEKKIKAICKVYGITREELLKYKSGGK